MLGVGGASEQITFANWYASASNHSALTLQMIEEASADFNGASGDPLVNQRVVTFNFAGLVNSFDAAGAPSSWAVMNELLNQHLSGSDTAAIGGDLAYRYGLNGSLAGWALTPIQGELSSAQFGAGIQTLQPLAGLQQGLVKLS